MEKVFGLGFSKTGTTSLETALETFGYKVCRGHWERPYTFYLHALWVHRDYDEIFRLVDYWDAFADAPWGGTTLYEELYRRLPNSKFVLTVRDPEKWYASLIKLLTMFDLNLETAFASYHSNGMYGSQYFFRHVFGVDTLQGTKQQIIDVYNAYNQGVIEFFQSKPDANFIVMDFEKGDGWEKLAPFLGQEIPAEPFPNQNQAIENPYLSNLKETPKRSLIVLIHLGHENDVESARYSRRTFAQYGYELIEVSLADPARAGAEINALLAERRDEIFAFMSANYYATTVGQNGTLLHKLTGIPLVIMMHDHPLHFLDQQTPNLEGTLAFVPGDDSRKFISAHYPPFSKPIANMGSLPPVESEVPNYEQFLGRKNVILAPLNLNFRTVTLDGAWQQIKDLPPARRARATALVEVALTDGVTPLHELATALPARLSVDDAQAALADQLVVLQFIKLWRRQQMVRALIDLPILVSSDYVPADLLFKYPKKFTEFTMAQTLPLYRDYRFTLNSHPLLSDLLHDRLMAAVALNSACITDVNSAVRRYFHDGIDAVFFDYAKLDEMAQRVSSYLDDPARAFELTVNAAAVRDASDNFGYREGYERLIDEIAGHWPSETRVSVLAPALV